MTNDEKKMLDRIEALTDEEVDAELRARGMKEPEPQAVPEVEGGQPHGLRVPNPGPRK